MAKIPTSVVNDKEFNSSIEKYKIARVQYIPSEDNDLVDAIIVDYKNNLNSRKASFQ